MFPKLDSCMKNNLLKLKSIVIVSIVCLLISCKTDNSKTKIENDSWHLMYAILDSIKPPVFKDKTFNILDFGAVADSSIMNSIAFENAIKACSESGGGKVVVPAGKYLTGPIHLLDNVNLHLEEGSELLFSTNPQDYYPLVHTSYEGTELMNYSPLIYAYKKKNIAVTGKGTLNGQANNTNWWPWCGKDIYGWKEGMGNQRDSLNLPVLMEMGENNTPLEERVFGNNHFLRPTFLEPFDCQNVLIEGIKIVNAPFWVIHPIKSKNVIVDGVTVDSHGPNNDGCDPEYSKNVLIKNCTFNTGDDCIAIKSGRNGDGRRVAIKSENIIIQNCKMIDGHGGVVIGSEISAGVRNVFAENCSMDSPELERAIRIKTNTKRGGLVENIYVRNIKIGKVKEAVLKVNMFYGIYGNQEGDFMPEIRNISLENITVKDGGKYGVLAEGYEESPIKNITLKNVIIEKVKEPYLLKNVDNIQFIDSYINGVQIKMK